MSSARPAGPASAVDSDGRPVEVSRRERRRERSGAAAFGQGASLLARAVQLAVSIVVAIIVAGILLVVLKANPANSIVSEVHSWAHWLAGPFDGMFSFHSANDAIAVNWGIAAVVYLFVGVVIARLIGGTRRYPLGRSSASNQEVP
jgi:hypothetical protein